jgi:hypothetical protein
LRSEQNGDKFKNIARHYQYVQSKRKQDFTLQYSIWHLIEWSDARELLVWKIK